jgi:hypothetical protein
MQQEFNLKPIQAKTKMYSWESREEEIKYAVLFNDKILAIFGDLYWAEYFADKANIDVTIMAVDE